MRGYGRWGRWAPDYPCRPHGPPAWVGPWEGCPCWCGPGPTSTERREELAAYNKDLEDRLAEINKELERF